MSSDATTPIIVLAMRRIILLASDAKTGKTIDH